MLTFLLYVTYVICPNLSQMYKFKTKRQPLDDMSHNIGVLLWPRACWLCPLLCPLCSARLPGHWAWHIRTAALSRCPLSFALSQSQTLQRRSRPETQPCCGLTGPRSDQASRRGSSSSPTSTCYDLWTDSKRPLTWFEQTVPLKSSLWFGFCSLERGEQGQATHRQEKAQAKAVCDGGLGGNRADSRAPGADGTLFYVWPQWIMSAKLLEAYNMEGSHKNIVNQNSKIH